MIQPNFAGAVRRVATALTLGLLATPAFAEFPDKPITVLVGFGAGAIGGIHRRKEVAVHVDHGRPLRWIVHHNCRRTLVLQTPRGSPKRAGHAVE